MVVNSCDSLMPSSVKVAALADAMFSVYSTDVAGQLSYVFDALCFVYTCRRLIDLSNDCRYPERMGWLYKHMNSSASVNQVIYAAPGCIYMPAIDRSLF